MGFWSWKLVDDAVINLIIVNNKIFVTVVGFRVNIGFDNTLFVTRLDGAVKIN